MVREPGNQFSVQLTRKKGHVTNIKEVRVIKANKATQTCYVEFCGNNNKSKPVTLIGSTTDIVKMLSNIINSLGN